MVFVSFPAGGMVMVPTDYGRTVVGTSMRRRYADGFESDHNRRSGNREHRQGQSRQAPEAYQHIAEATASEAARQPLGSTCPIVRVAEAVSMALAQWPASLSELARKGGRSS